MRRPAPAYGYTCSIALRAITGKQAGKGSRWPPHQTTNGTGTTLRVFCRSCATISHRVPERELEANVTQTSIKIPQVDFD
jgi:hypothetical protein